MKCKNDMEKNLAGKCPYYSLRSSNLQFQVVHTPAEHRQSTQFVYSSKSTK
jgi:hypothetical protein